MVPPVRFSNLGINKTNKSSEYNCNQSRDTQDFPNLIFNGS